MPVVYQDWCRAGFVHWRYPSHAVQAVLPEGLRVDTYASDAWVSLTPFIVERMRVMGSPPLPHLPAFCETNLRTYVIGPDGTRGIWFMALDCTSMLSVALGRGVYMQPYFHSDLSVERTTQAYRGIRRWPRAGPRYALDLQATADADSELDHFLTGRWTFFTFYGPVAASASVEHEPWPLRRARVLRCEETFTKAAGLPQPPSEPIAHWSPGVHAKLGAPRPVARR